jgi:hypothetical protein
MEIGIKASTPCQIFIGMQVIFSRQKGFIIINFGRKCENYDS